MNEQIKQLYEENKQNPVAWVLIGIGLMILIGGLWPLFILLPGLALIFAATQGGKSSTGLIFPGAVIAGTGAILFVQNLTGHFESWAYAWTLYPVFVGLAMRYHGERTGKRDEVDTGKTMVKNALMAFAGFALFFELLIFQSLSAWLLLAAGAALLWWNGRISLGEKDAEYKQKVRDFVKEKREQVNMTTGDDVVQSSAEPTKQKNQGDPSPVINPDLQRQIKQALAEDETDTDTETKAETEVEVEVETEKDKSDSNRVHIPIEE